MNKTIYALILSLITFCASSEKLLFSAEIASQKPISSTGTMLQSEQNPQTNQSLVNSKNDLLSITATSTIPTTSTYSLINYFRANAVARSNINLLYGMAIKSSGALTTYELSTLSRVTSTSGYSQSAFLTSLTKTTGLYRALQSNTAQRQAFNKKYQSYLQPSGSPMSADRAKLYSATAPWSYSQSTFLNSLASVPTKPVVTVSSLPSGALFSTSSFWNTKNHTSVHSNSWGLVQELLRQTRLAAPWLNTNMYSTPLYIVNSSTPKVPVSIVSGGRTMSWTKLHVDSMKGVPIPSNAVAAGGTDGHITIWDTSTNKLYEYWQLKKNWSGKWQASWGGIIENASNSSGVMPIVKNSQGGTEYWGATGSGLAAIGGTILIKELKAGRIPHALAMAIPYAKYGFVAPANRSDGGLRTTNAIAEGTRFKLPSWTTIDSSWPPILKMIVTAARDYGIIVRDQAGAVTLYAEDSRQYGSSPYPAYYGGLALDKVMAKFPWSKLQVTK